MAKRERLIKILKNNQGDNTYYMTDMAVNKIVDVLLENGVEFKELYTEETNILADKLDKTIKKQILKKSDVVKGEDCTCPTMSCKYKKNRSYKRV